MYLLMVLISAILFTIGGVFMKLSEGLSQPIPTLLVYIFFIAGASIQTVAMRKATLGVTYIVVLGLESILAVLFGVVLFQESLSYINVIGVSFIVAGMGFLQGKKALICGLASNRSIAYGIAKAFHEQGAELAFTYQNDKLKDRVEKMAAEFGSEIVLPCDVSSDDQINAVFDSLKQHWSHLDCLVHSVAYAPADA